MMLTLTEPFEGFVPIEKTSDDKCAWREEYKATAADGKAVRLVAYALDKLPKGMEADNITEFRIYEKSQCKAFHKMLSNGKDEALHIAWMALEDDAETVSLANWVARNGAMNARVAAEVAKLLLEGVKAVGKLTNDGGIYNICPENIEVAIDGNAEQPTVKAAYITNLYCAGEQYNGNAHFSVSTLNRLYTAPEARYGRFCNASDIYVMGLVLAYMSEGQYPWDTDGVKTLSQLELRRMKNRRMTTEEGLQTVISRTLTNNIRLRYKNADEMTTALRVFLGEVEESEEEKAKNERRKKQIRSDLSNKPKDNEEESNTNEKQPTCNVEFAELKGNGFGDVAGMSEVKRQFRRDYVDIVRNKEMAEEFGIQPPSLTLMASPPGCGKTFIARKLAEECGLQFCYISPAQLGNIFIHGSQQMIADLFAKAEKKAKETNTGVLIMLDEFDGLAASRSTSDYACHNDEVNELLTQLNECSSRGIYVLAATNRPDMLDSAVTRSGRMDSFIYLGLPDLQARKEMLELELKKRPHDSDLDINRLASITDGFTSSDICAIVKAAGREAFDRSIHTEDKSVVKISQELLEETINRSRPSVSADELREYEHARDKFMNKKDKNRPRIGFGV